MRIKNTLRDVARLILRPRLYCEIRYILSHRRKLNLCQPVFYTEKIQYRKLCSNPISLAKYVDKLEVKSIISSFDLDIYIPKVYDIFYHVNETDLLKYKGTDFVIKTTHGGGGKYLDVFSKGDVFDALKLAKKYNNLLSIKTGEKIDERFYDIIKPRVFIEENLDPNKHGQLIDYKFHVFNGCVEFIQLNHRVTMHDYTMTLVDANFSKLPFTLNKSLKSLDQNKLIKPKLFEKAIFIAENLSAGFNYVRVDLYITDEKIIFGELTFCPSSGWSKVYPDYWDEKIGNLWDITKEFV